MNEEHVLYPTHKKQEEEHDFESERNCEHKQIPRQCLICLREENDSLKTENKRLKVQLAGKSDTSKTGKPIPDKPIRPAPGV